MVWSYLHNLHLFIFSCSVCAIRNLLILLNSPWISAYTMKVYTNWITDKKLLHFKLSKLGRILYVDKTGFPRPCKKYRKSRLVA